jgi:hypothetical protein
VTGSSASRVHTPARNRAKKNKILVT